MRFKLSVILSCVHETSSRKFTASGIFRIWYDINAMLFLLSISLSAWYVEYFPRHRQFDSISLHAFIRQRLPSHHDIIKQQRSKDVGHARFIALENRIHAARRISCSRRQR